MTAYYDSAEAHIQRIPCSDQMLARLPLSAPNQKSGLAELVMGHVVDSLHAELGESEPERET